MPTLRHVCRAFLRRDTLVDASYRANWFFRISAVFFSLWSLFFLGRAFGRASPFLARFDGDYFAFALIGVTFTVLTSGALSGVARRIRELQLLGGIEAIFAAPVAPFQLILMFALYPMLLAMVQAGFFLGFGIGVFGASYPKANLPAATLATLLSIATYLAFGILSASIVLIIKRGDPVAWLLNAFTYLLSGVVYPIEVLPAALHPLSTFLPATHALDALRLSLMLSADWTTLAHPLSTLLLYCAILWPLAALSLHLALQKALREGTLGQP